MALLQVSGNLSISDSQVNQVTGDQYNVINKPDERRAIAEWLSPLNFESYQTKIFLERVEGTGQWLLESKTFQSWRDAPSGTLFCPGMPGSGKTVMSSIVIDHLRKNFHHTTDIAVAFVYLDYKKPSEQTPLNLMSNLLKQLIQPPFVSLVDVGSLYQTHRRWSSQPTLDDVRTAINKEIAKLGKVFIVVDALDELSEENRARAEFLKAIHSLTGSVNLMVTSREIPSIMLAFQDAIRLDICARDSDVKRYVRDWIPDWYPEDLQDIVIQRLPQKASGMFLLARLHMDALMECQSVAEVREAIHGLPQDITATYGNAIERIKQQRERSRKLAFAVLSWVTFAGRPLTVTELQFAVAVQPGMTTLTSEHAINETKLTSYCAGLIVIDDKTRLVRLVHYSTQEYFETKREELFPEAQIDITKTCLTYLLFNEFQRDITCDAQTLFRFWLKYPLLDYATRYWPRHIRGQAEVTERTLLHKLLQAPHRRECLSRIALLDLHIDAPPINLSTVRSTLKLPSHLFLQTNFTTLHLCAFFGLRQTIEHELANGAQADQRDGEGRTPLTWAAHNGHDNVVSFFLHRPDVDVRSRDSYGRTPLCWAARNDHYSVVKLLLSRPAVNVNNQDCVGRTPLYSAAWNGNNAIVALLLSLGDVDVNLRDQDGRSPLLRAAELGHHDVVTSLLTRADIDVNSDDEDDHTLLSLAVKGGHHEVVKLLLAYEGATSHGVNVNCTDQDRRTPLHWAAKNGCDAIVDLLLAHSAVQPNLRDALGLTPFWLAVQNRHKTTVQRLLTHRLVMASVVQSAGLHQAVQTGDHDTFKFLLALQVFSVNTQDAPGWTPLLLATYHGYTPTVSLLLAYPSIDVNIPNQQHRTPLHLAVERGHDEVVDLLLTCDTIRINALDIRDETALLLGAWWGRTAIVKKLLGCPFIDVNIPNQQDQTPLHLAVERGHDEVVDLLLTCDTIRINALDIRDETALLLGARWGRTAIVKKLLGCPFIDVNIPDQQDQTPLHLAVERGHDEVVDLLLLHDTIQVDALDHCDETPLLLGARCGHTTIVKKLLACTSIDVNIPDQQYRTPLHLAAVNGHHRVVEFLLAHPDIYLNPRDKYGSTPLLLAVEMGHTLAVRQFLAHPSVDVNLVNHPNYGGRTPLHLAAGYGHSGVVGLLLAHDNIQINAHDTHNVTPLLLATWAAGMRHDKAGVKQLLTHPVAEVITPDDQGRTALHLAAENGDLLVVHARFSLIEPLIDRLSLILIERKDPYLLWQARRYLNTINFLRARGATMS